MGRLILKILTLSLMALSLCIPVSLVAQTQREGTLLSYALPKWNSISRIVVDSVTAYLAVDTGISVFDVSYPQSPVEEAFIFKEEVLDIAVSSDLLFIALPRALEIYDISDVHSPVLLSQTTQVDNHPIYLRRILVDGNQLYVHYDGDSTGSLAVLDVSNPVNPALLGSVQVYLFDFLLQGNYIIGVDRYSGLKIINVTNPANPQIQSSTDIPGYPISVAVSDNYAYVSVPNAGIYSLGISDPSNPVLLGLCSNHSGFVNISGNYLYIGESTGLFIADTTNPSNLSIIDSLLVQGGAEHCIPLLSEEKAYIWNYDLGFVLIDNSNISDMHIISHYQCSGCITGVQVVGDIAYVVDYGVGLRFINISDPLNPSICGGIYTDLAIVDAVVNGDFVYMFVCDDLYEDYSVDVLVYDISNLSHCTAVSIFRLPGQIYARDLRIKCAGSYLYINLPYLTIIDVSDPQNLSVAGSLIDTGSNDLAIEGDYAYISGMMVVDISNPGAPFEVGNLTLEGYPLAIDVSGNYAVGLYDEWHHDPEFEYQTTKCNIVDVSDPSNPFLAGRCHLIPDDNPGIEKVIIQGDYAFVGNKRRVELVHMANPQHPIDVGDVVFVFEYLEDFEVRDDLMFAANYYYLGIYNFSSMLPVSDQTEPAAGNNRLQQNQPNPFSKSTDIEYTLVKESDVRLEIYNIKGQRVRQIVNTRQKKGSHQVSWNGYDSTGHRAAPGVYLFKLETESGHLSRKCLLLR